MLKPFLIKRFVDIGHVLSPQSNAHSALKVDLTTAELSNQRKSQSWPLRYFSVSAILLIYMSKLSGTFPKHYSLDRFFKGLDTFCSRAFFGEI